MKRVAFSWDLLARSSKSESEAANYQIPFSFHSYNLRFLCILPLSFLSMFFPISILFCMISMLMLKILEFRLKKYLTGYKYSRYCHDWSFSLNSSLDKYLYWKMYVCIVLVLYLELNKLHWSTYFHNWDSRRFLFRVRFNVLTDNFEEFEFSNLRYLHIRLMRSDRIWLTKY